MILKDLEPHIRELRVRMLYIFVFALLAMCLSFYFVDDIISFITKPLRVILDRLHINNSSYDGKITTHQVGGAFFVAIRVSATAGLLASFPVILYHIYKFVAPGLYKNEKSFIYPFLIGGSIMFALGLLFSYYLVVPYGFKYLITFGAKNYIPYINIENYVGFFMRIMVAFAISFELPVIIFLLAKVKIVNDKILIKFFRYAIVVIFIFSAIITPPDIMTQLLLSLPLILLYLFSIVIAKLINPSNKNK